jgi:hypothetical protein
MISAPATSTACTMPSGGGAPIMGLPDLQVRDGRDTARHHLPRACKVRRSGTRQAAGCPRPARRLYRRTKPTGVAPGLARTRAGASTVANSVINNEGRTGYGASPPIRRGHWRRFRPPLPSSHGRPRGRYEDGAPPSHPTSGGTRRARSRPFEGGSRHRARTVSQTMGMRSCRAARSSVDVSPTRPPHTWSSVARTARHLASASRESLRLAVSRMSPMQCRLSPRTPRSCPTSVIGQELTMVVPLSSVGGGSSVAPHRSTRGRQARDSTHPRA